MALHLQYKVYIPKAASLTFSLFLPASSSYINKTSAILNRQSFQCEGSQKEGLKYMQIPDNDV